MKLSDFYHALDVLKAQNNVLIVSFGIFLHAINYTRSFYLTPTVRRTHKHTKTRKICTHIHQAIQMQAFIDSDIDLRIIRHFTCCQILLINHWLFRISKPSRFHYNLIRFVRPVCRWWSHVRITRWFAGIFCGLWTQDSKVRFCCQ